YEPQRRFERDLRGRDSCGRALHRESRLRRRRGSRRNQRILPVRKQQHRNARLAHVPARERQARERAHAERELEPQCAVAASRRQRRDRPLRVSEGDMTCTCWIIPPRVLRRFARDRRLSARARKTFADAIKYETQWRKLRAVHTELAAAGSALESAVVV